MNFTCSSIHVHTNLCSNDCKHNFLTQTLHLPKQNSFKTLFKLIIISILITTIFMIIIYSSISSVQDPTTKIIKKRIIPHKSVQSLSGQVDNTKNNGKPPNFKPIGTKNITLKSPKVQYTKNPKNTIKYQNLKKKIPISIARSPIVIGEHANGQYIPNIQAPPSDIVLYTMENVLFTSEAVMIFDNNYVLFTRACHPRYWEQFYTSPSEVVLQYDIYENAICLGHQHSSDFGHWFLEVLPCYLIIPSDILKNCVVVLPYVKPYIEDAFSYIGVTKDQIVVGENKPYFARNYYTADFSICGDLNSYLIIQMKKRFEELFEIGDNPPTKSVTFNRLNMSRCIGNYVELQERLKKSFPTMQWEDVPKLKTLKEQAKYFDQVKFLFAVHGSVLANIIFMQPKTAIVELQMEQWLLSFIYLSAFTDKYHVCGRDPKILWRGMKPNILDLDYVEQLVQAALKAAKYI